MPSGQLFEAEPPDTNILSFIFHAFFVREWQLYRLKINCANLECAVQLKIVEDS